MFIYIKMANIVLKEKYSTGVVHELDFSSMVDIVLSYVSQQEVVKYNLLRQGEMISRTAPILSGLGRLILDFDEDTPVNYRTSTSDLRTIHTFDINEDTYLSVRTRN